MWQCFVQLKKTAIMWITQTTTHKTNKNKTRIKQKHFIWNQKKWNDDHLGAALVATVLWTKKQQPWSRPKNTALTEAVEIQQREKVR